MLEIGVDRGITFLPLLASLLSTRPEFSLFGVDVRLQEHVSLIVEHMGPYSETQSVLLMEGNSLTVMPELAKQRCRFDLLLIDGDHNYHTVSNELRCVDALLAPGGFAVLDDVDGRWSDRDLWYSEREGYEGNLSATKRVDTEKHGVRAALEDFLAAEPRGRWTTAKPIPGEPVVLHRTGEIRLV